MFFFLIRSEYNLKMQALLDDKTTYETVAKNPFGRVERELNSKNHQLFAALYHKEGHPQRPIVNCTGSALYNTSKYLTEILSPIQNKNNNSVQNSTEFVRFDVVSLFTAIPVQKACQYIRTKLEQDDTLTSRTNLTIDDIIFISLLQFIHFLTTILFITT